MDNIGIYKFTNLINNKVYIGQSTQLTTRISKHKQRYNNINDHQYDGHFYRALRKYGLDNFHIEIIELCSKEMLNEREIFYMTQYNSTDRDYGYNLSMRGYVQSGMKLTNDTLPKIIEMLEDGFEYIEIANLFNVSRQTISQINIGTTWFNPNIQYPIRTKSKAAKEREKKNKRFICPKCGRDIPSTQYCLSCDNTHRKVEIRPEPLELARLVTERGFLGVGRIYGVSDNTIKKWCKSYKIPHLIKDLKRWYLENK